MIGIVNYGAGNIFSLTSALDRLKLSYGMINTESDFDQYSHIIIPAHVWNFNALGLIE